MNDIIKKIKQILGGSGEEGQTPKPKPKPNN